MCMGILITALLAMLLLNTATAQAAFETTKTQREYARLVQDNDELAALLDEKSSPEQLAAAARALGMVPATGTGWIRLSDQTVSGAPAPAQAEPEPEAGAGEVPPAQAPQAPQVGADEAPPAQPQDEVGGQP